MVMGGPSFRGKPWEKNKGRKPSYGKTSYGKPSYSKSQGMTPSKFDANVRRNDACSYCGKPGYYSRDCFKRRNDESKHRNK
jgi:hypothetical protein